MGCSSLNTKHRVKPLCSAEPPPPSAACLDTHQCCCRWIGSVILYPRAAQSWFFTWSSETKEWLFHIETVPQWFPNDQLISASLSKCYRNKTALRLLPSLTIGLTGLQFRCFNHVHHQASYSWGFLWTSWEQRSEINRLVGTVRTDNRSEEYPGIFQEMLCPCIQEDRGKYRTQWVPW